MQHAMRRHFDSNYVCELQVRRQSYNEYKIFRRRWKQAVEEDKCWTDPYPESVK